ncbi:MAG: dephospho-CoA kinase [Pseudomonadota bacterium]
MIILALTGSIGMGKSTTATMFADAGIPVWDADATVHKLYGEGGEGSKAIAGIVPEAVDANGVNRDSLRQSIMDDPSLLKKVEGVIHPLVGKDRAAFLSDARTQGEALVVVDIPLLFEGGGEAHVDKIVVVTAPADIQRARVLERPGMTIEAFETILSKQVPDEIKRQKADYLIDTSLGMDNARDRVSEIIADLIGANDA